MAIRIPVHSSRRLDSTTAGLQAVVPRGWFLLGTLSLAPAFIWGAPSMSELAIGIGGVLLALQAFIHLAGGLERCAAAVIAWRRIQPFWKAAGHRDPPGEPYRGPRPSGSHPDAMPLLDLRDIVFRYPGRPEPVLRQVALQVRRGDRILLEGPSGGGKSTLGALLAGQRIPESGLLLLDGLDRETLGSDGWRRKSVIVPQFHENHVFLGSFAFNALMGRGWPPSLEDLKEVEGICRTLGLGPLIDRMPGGILQMVGETGWQLSHGERSRLYIARALLQGPEVLILDESFAALDPETLRSTLGYVLERAPTLIVIAHP
jgi:ATP-binding cassette subfamily B protein